MTLEEAIEHCKEEARKECQIGNNGCAEEHLQLSDWPENWSIRGFNNKLMRNIPLKDQSGKGYIYGIRPSYWNPKHQFFCKMPE